MELPPTSQASQQLSENPELNGDAGMSLRGKGGIIDLAGEKLKQLQGRVFHAVVDNNRILQYRISHDGKLILEKTIKSLHLDSLKDKSSKLLEGAAEVRLKSKRKWRKVVTGDPDKRIRDHMKEVPQVKFVDKLSFTLGVVVIVLSEWIALRVPSYFPLFYFLLMGVLLSWRYISYKADKFQYFMLDFCYYVNMSVFLQYYLAPGNSLWFKANYIFAMGPLCSAIIVWRNSLVFHSLDKVTSFFLHALPPMTLHLTRWNFIPEVSQALESSGNALNFSFFSFYIFPIIFYLAWQLIYLFLTEHVLASKFREDPELITALRYLSSDRKSSMNKSLHKFLWKKKFLAEGEHLDPDSLKCKMIFVLIQFVFTVVTIAYIPLLYYSYAFSCFYLALIFTWGTWNGASYYIEVFSKRYNIQFEEMNRKSEMTSTTDVPARVRLDTADSEAQTTDDRDDEDDDDYNGAYHDFAGDQVLTEDMAEEIYTALADLESASSASASSSRTSTVSAPASESVSASSSGVKMHKD